MSEYNMLPIVKEMISETDNIDQRHYSFSPLGITITEKGQYIIDPYAIVTKELLEMVGCNDMVLPEKTRVGVGVTFMVPVTFSYGCICEFGVSVYKGSVVGNGVVFGQYTTFGEDCVFGDAVCIGGLSDLSLLDLNKSNITIGPACKLPSHNSINNLTIRPHALTDSHCNDITIVKCHTTTDLYSGGMVNKQESYVEVISVGLGNKLHPSSQYEWTDIGLVPRESSPIREYKLNYLSNMQK